jgi:hypothetical protein
MIIKGVFLNLSLDCTIRLIIWRNAVSDGLEIG